MPTITIPIEVLESMKNIIDMYIKDEERDYESCACLGEHIYNNLELVNRFLHSQDLQADIDKSYAKEKKFGELTLEIIKNNTINLVDDHKRHCQGDCNIQFYYVRLLLELADIQLTDKEKSKFN